MSVVQHLVWSSDPEWLPQVISTLMKRDKGKRLLIVLLKVNLCKELVVVIVVIFNSKYVLWQNTAPF